MDKKFISSKKFISLASQLKVASISESLLPKIEGFENSDLKPIAIMTACISQVDYLNANGFYIERKEMEDMLEANKEYIAAGKAVMLAGHDEREPRDEDVRNKLIAGIIKDVWLEPDGKVFAKTVIANTDAGKNIVALALAGLGIQASTRLGIVPTKTDAGYDGMIGKDSIFYGFDVVLDPAIENTWLEFKAASKVKTSEGVVATSAKTDIDEYTMELSYNINKVKEALAFEIAKNKILKNGNK